MLSRIVDIAKAVITYLPLKHRIPTYTERADYYRQRAILESMKNGVRIDSNNGEDLIDAETTAITLPNDKHIEFAWDSNGIYFARIEDGKYYPIDIKPSEDLLKKARRFEKLSGSYWRRAFHEYFELVPYEPAIFSIDRANDSVSDFNFILEDFVKNLEQSTELLEQKVRELPRGVEKL